MAAENNERVRNKLLAALPRTEWSRLSEDAETVALEFKYMIYEAHSQVEHVYFPLEGVVSLLSLMRGNTALEVATVGNEGMVGLAAFLGGVKTPLRTLVQIPGKAIKISVEAFREEIGRLGKLQALLNLYTQALFTQIAQGNGCNNVHSVEKRCARWLLTTHDRVDSDEFSLTQEFLAQMLGVRRATVTEVARSFQKAGLIVYRRGSIKILKRKDLEGLSCECYKIIRDEYERLLNVEW
jgi:CRP-like cAMP-binding protein